MKKSFITPAVNVGDVSPAVMASSVLSRSDKFVIAMTTATTLSFVAAAAAPWLWRPRSSASDHPRPTAAACRFTGVD